MYPVDIREALRTLSFTPGQFDWVVVDSSVELAPHERRQVEQVARLVVIDVDGDDWSVKDVSEDSVKRAASHLDGS